MLDHKTDTLSSFVVNIPGINPPSLTNNLRKVIIQQMCEAAGKTVQVQCGREYGFSNKSDVKTTVLTVLDSKDLEGLPTNNLISERHFSKLDRLAKVAKSRNHQFKAKSIRNNMTLIKFNQGKVDCLSRRLSQILTAHENL